MRLEVSRGVEECSTEFSRACAGIEGREDLRHHRRSFNASIQRGVDQFRCAMRVCWWCDPVFCSCRTWKGHPWCLASHPRALVGTLPVREGGTGLPLNQLTLSVWLLATGLRVDDAITVIERHLHQEGPGMDRPGGPPWHHERIVRGR